MNRAEYPSLFCKNVDEISLVGDSQAEIKWQKSFFLRFTHYFIQKCLPKVYLIIQLQP